jgi:serine/threonine protein kinase
MTDPAALIEVLRRWQEAVAQGREPTPEELVPQQPELHRALWLALAALRGVQNVDPDAVSLGAERPEAIGTVIYRGDSSPEVPVPSLGPPAYEILGEISRDDVSIIYHARARQINRDAAIKFLVAGDPVRFLAEVQTLARLAHPHIVQIFEVGEHEGRPYFVTEYCSAGSLEQRLALRLPTPREAASLVRDLAGAVQAAHTAGVLIRNLAPSGIWFSVAPGPAGEVVAAADLPVAAWDRLVPKLADFSLCRQLDTPSPVGTPVLGTPGFMAPEQVNASPDIGPAADIYALGAILYTCLTGRPPFRAATATETLLQVVERDPVPVRQLQPGVQANLETICLKCLAREPARRYPSAQALADDLGNFLASRPITARPAGVLERTWLWMRRNPVIAGLLAALVLTQLASVVSLTLLAAHLAGRK